MALTVEDGSVVTGADCYENAADTATRLTNQDYSGFDGKSPTEKEGIIRKATLRVERYLNGKVEGIKTEDDQPRLFPREHCFTYGMEEEFDYDEIPEILKEGIALDCEHLSGVVLPLPPAGVDSVEMGPMKVRFQSKRDGSTHSFEKESPEAAKALRPLIWHS